MGAARFRWFHSKVSHWGATGALSLPGATGALLGATAGALSSRW